MTNRNEKGAKPNCPRCHGKGYVISRAGHYYKGQKIPAGMRIVCGCADPAGTKKRNKTYVEDLGS